MVVFLKARRLDHPESADLAVRLGALGIRAFKLAVIASPRNHFRLIVVALLLGWLLSDGLDLAPMLGNRLPTGTFLSRFWLQLQHRARLILIGRHVGRRNGRPVGQLDVDPFHPLADPT